MAARASSHFVKRVVISTILSLHLSQGLAQMDSLPEGFVYLREVAPDILSDLRYFSSVNFTGAPVPGYEAPQVIITKQAAMALKDVQLELKEQGVGLVVYDAYRPQQAVDHFIEWLQTPVDSAQKASYFPNVPKSELFRRGYIAERSSHSRGSSVDVSLVDLSSGKPLDMGTDYDFFDPKSWPSSKAVTEAQKKNRMLLQRIMRKHGFEPLGTEWWHFNLRGEPFPQTYFDFSVK